MAPQHVEMEAKLMTDTKREPSLENRGLQMI
jgi:hypothetical protein